MPLLFDLRTGVHLRENPKVPSPNWSASPRRLRILQLGELRVQPSFAEVPHLIAAAAARHCELSACREHTSVGEGAHWETMKPSRAGPRRHLPSSPFNVQVPDSPVETFAVHDQITHDKYGLGVVLAVEGVTALLVDFGTHKVRVAIPCAKVVKL